MHRVLSATCAAVAEFNVGVAATMRHLCEVMGVAQGQQLMASAEKTDARRLQQAERQMTASPKKVRCARRLARQAEAQSTADYAARAFSLNMNNAEYCSSTAYIHLLVISMIYTLVVSLCASVFMFSSYYLLRVYMLYTLWKNVRCYLFNFRIDFLKKNFLST